jgi:hypothetical protein
MDDFRIEPPLLVKDTPKPRRLASLDQARAFVKEALERGRPPAWRDIYHRLQTVRDADDGLETIGALRELLELEDLLVRPDLPLETKHPR